MFATDIGRKQCGSHRKPADVLSGKKVLRGSSLVSRVVKAYSEYSNEVGSNNEGIHWNRAVYLD